MALIEASPHTNAIWSAAIRDAAPVFSAYLTPLGYSVGSFAVRAISSENPELSAEVAARLDLGRARQVVALLQAIDDELNTVYRHEVVLSRGYVRGKPHIPRYLQMLARGDQRGIPVLFAQRRPTTPENLLVSEIVRTSRLVCDVWMSRGGAESVTAIEMADQLARFETRSPWSVLRAHSRPVLRDLSATVEGRIIAGIVDSNGPLAALLKLFPSEDDSSATAFGEAANALTFLACNDARFEDRVFELLTLSWLLDAFRRVADTFRFEPALLRSAAGRPCATATVGAVGIEVFFQSSVALPDGHWRYVHSGSPFRALPDIVVRVRLPGAPVRVMIVDAKNRSAASESEVAYKLLGYRENLRLDQYIAVGVYPALRSGLRLRRLKSDESQIVLMHIPLEHGRRIARRLVRASLGNLRGQ